MPDYLLEIGVEELPADHVPEAQERLKSLLSERLAACRLSFREIAAYGTPRRIACIVKGLAGIQETIAKKVKGPPVKSSFDAGGKPLPPASGFAARHGLTVEELECEEIGGVSYLVANLTIAGRPAEAVLAEIVPPVIEQISGERLMRWGTSELRFSRPIRWLVSLLDRQPVKFALDGLGSGSETCGHRMLAPGKHRVGGPDSYVEDLRQVFVLVDPAERRQVIERAVTEAAGKVSGRPRQLMGPLIEEVVNITEWPCAVLGQFESEYLDLPEALIETVMVHHQRYFPVEGRVNGSGQAGRLLAFFICVANNDRPGAQETIRRGNERVLRARLADGRFFYFDDQKTGLGQRKEALAQLTFHEGLGSYLEKQERLAAAAAELSAALSLDAKLAVCLERTLELCKLDLVTNLVRELPELQGFVGSWYAGLEGEPPDVVAAIASHYSPRSTEDTIPGDRIGCLAAVIDKLDNLVALFASGKRPTGSSDPYILRRQAQGVIDILADGLPQFPVNVSALMKKLLSLLEPKLAAYKRLGDPETMKRNMEDLREFLLQRLRIKLADRGFRREVVEAVLAARDPLADIPDVVMRCACLEKLIASPGGLDVVRAGVRVGNILTPGSPDEVHPERFEHPSEKDLWQRFNQEVVMVWQKGGEPRVPASEAEYLELLDLLGKVARAVDALFDNVMVNDPDPAKRDNRHALLKQIDRYFRSTADFPRLQPLLL